MSILRNEYVGAMLILDNLDFPGKTISAIQNEQAYRDLSSLDLQLVFTTRSAAIQQNSITIGPLSDGLLLKLMRNIAPSVECDDRKLLSLIHAVDGHTLTVDLMARTMEDSWGDVTPDILLESLRTASVKQDIYPAISNDQNGWYRMGRLDQHLQVLFDLRSFSDEEYAILRCATLLPSGGMDIKLFLSPFKEKTWKKLLDSGWLSVENGLVRIHPVIRIVCVAALKPCEENCNNFLISIRNQYDRRQYDSDKFRQIAELFENASTTLDDQTGFWSGEAGYFWKEIGEPGRALELELRGLELRKQNLSEPKELATAYNNVGNTYGDLGDHEKALEYQIKALEIQERGLQGDHPDLAISYGNVGYTYGALGDHEKELEYYLKALMIREQVLPPNHPDFATSYNNVGYTYGALGDHEKELEYYLKALMIREQVLPPIHPDFATSYNNVGMTYGALGDHKKALEFQLKALEIHERVLPMDHPYNVMCCSNIAVTYARMDDFANAVSYIRRAVESGEHSMRGHPNLEQLKEVAEIMELLSTMQKNNIPFPFDNPFKT